MRDSRIVEIFACIKRCAIALQEILQSDDSGYLSSTNTSGDMQLAVDVRADAMLERELLKLSCVQGICSEEKSSALYKQGDNNKAEILESTSLQALDGGLLVAYDPLDGSSLFDANLSIGSIFGIYDSAFSASALVAATYVVYGPRLEVVLAHEGVEHYVYSRGEWISKPTLQLESNGKLNAPGGTQKHWSREHKDLVDSLFAQGYRLRYSGGMVPDLHQILCKKGGLFSYPATSDAPSGKLRKLFEVFPFAFIYEKAGGEAIDGQKRLLSLSCGGLHERTPCFLGSSVEIDQVRAVYAERRHSEPES